MGINSAAYQPLTNTFKELNNLLISQQQFNAEMTQREQQFALSSKMQEQDIKDRMLQRQLTQFKIDDIKKMRTPAPFNLYSMAPKGPMTDKHVYSRPEIMEELRAVLDPNDQYGLTFSRAEGQFKTPDGGVFQISPQHVAELAPALTGIIDRRVDGISLATDSLMRLQNKRNKISKALHPTAPRGRGDDAGTKFRNAEAKVQLADIDAKIMEAQRALTPEAQLDYYRSLKNRQQQRLGWASGVGNRDLMDYFTRAHAEAADMEKIALKEYLDSIGQGKSKGQPVQKYAIRVVNGKMVPGSIRVLNVPKNMPGGMTPGSVARAQGGEQLSEEDGWQWLEGAKALDDFSSDADKSATVVSILNRFYGTQIQGAQGSIEWVVSPERAGAYKMAVSKAGELYKKHKGDQPLASIASMASKEADQAALDYAKEYQKISGDIELSPEEKETYLKYIIDDLMKEYNISEDVAMNVVEGV
jgi:hypothetical protein